MAELLIPIAYNYETGQKVVTNFYKTPHMLIIGPSGSGKTNYLRNVLPYFKKMGATVFLIDFKNDLYDMDEYVDKIVTDITKKLIDELYELFTVYRKSLNGTLKPFILIFEEFIGLISYVENTLGKKDAERLKSLMSMIAAVGRSKGLFEIIVIQRPDAQFIGGDTRSNLGNKIVLGNGRTNLKDSLDMAFGTGTGATFENEMATEDVKQGMLLYGSTKKELGRIGLRPIDIFFEENSNDLILEYNDILRRLL